MVNQQLLEYVKTQLKNGFKKDDLLAAVRKAGWQETAIQDVFVEIERPAVRPAAATAFPMPSIPQRSFSQPTPAVAARPTIAPTQPAAASSAYSGQSAATLQKLAPIALGFPDKPAVPVSKPATVTPSALPVQQAPQMRKPIALGFPSSSASAAPVSEKPKMAFGETTSRISVPSMSAGAPVLKPFVPNIVMEQPAMIRTAVPAAVAEIASQPEAARPMLAAADPKAAMLEEENRKLRETIELMKKSASAPKPTAVEPMPQFRNPVTPISQPQVTQTGAMPPTMAAKPSPVLSAADLSAVTITPFKSSAAAATPAFQGMRPNPAFMPAQPAPAMRGMSIGAGPQQPIRPSAVLPPVVFQQNAKRMMPPKKKSHAVLWTLIVLIVLLIAAAAYAEAKFPAETRAFLTQGQQEVMSLLGKKPAADPNQVLDNALMRAIGSTSASYTASVAGSMIPSSASSTAYDISVAFSGSADKSGGPRIKDSLTFTLSSKTSTTTVRGEADLLVPDSSAGYIKVSLPDIISSKFPPALQKYEGQWIQITGADAAAQIVTSSSSSAFAAHKSEIIAALENNNPFSVSQVLADDTLNGTPVYHYIVSTDASKAQAGIDAVEDILNRNSIGLAASSTIPVAPDISKASVPPFEIWISKDTQDILRVKTASFSNAGGTFQAMIDFSGYNVPLDPLQAPQNFIKASEVMNAIFAPAVPQPKAKK